MTEKPHGESEEENIAWNRFNKIETLSTYRMLRRDKGSSKDEDAFWSSLLVDLSSLKKHRSFRDSLLAYLHSKHM